MRLLCFVLLMPVIMMYCSCVYSILHTVCNRSCISVFVYIIWILDIGRDRKGERTEKKQQQHDKIEMHCKYRLIHIRCGIGLIFDVGESVSLVSVWISHKTHREREYTEKKKKMYKRINGHLKRTMDMFCIPLRMNKKF